jgi:hypothetical protein
VTIEDILATVGHPLGQRGRTTCPLHQGKNPSAFSYNATTWFCFSGCGGGGIKDLADRLGLLVAPPPGVVPRGAEFAFDLAQLRQRPSRVIWQPFQGQLSRLLTAKVEETEAWVAYQWEVEHRRALCEYRNAEEHLRNVHPADLDFAFKEMADALKRLESTHRHLRFPCTGDCYIRDDPRPRD